MMLSTLAARYGPGDVLTFSTAFPHPWIVWEPGPWMPSHPGETMMLSPKAGSSQRASRSPNGEALALSLTPDPIKLQLTLGRGEGSDLPVNDATLSRQHLLFRRAGVVWEVQDAGSSNGSWLNGVKMVPRQSHSLRSGAQIQAGQVYLTYYDPGGLFSRIKVGR
jgi:hypothetical protein